MNLRRLLPVVVVALCLSLTAHAQDGKTSSPEERAHWVQVLHQLEAQPEDQATISAAEGVFKRLIEVSDFHMTICPVIGELPSKYSHTQPIMQLFTIGLAAYQVETGKMDNEGANLYALHSVLKGYAVILEHDPKAKDKKLDELVKQDQEGKLLALVKKKDCK